MSFNSNANIYFNKTAVPLKRCDHTGVTFNYDIEISCTWTMPPGHYPKFSMSTLQMWVLKSGVVDLKQPMQSVPITTNVGSSNTVQERCTRYNIIQLL